MRPSAILFATLFTSATALSSSSSIAATGTAASRNTDRQTAADDNRYNQCAMESAAFAMVSGLARDFDGEKKIFNGALYELREQLFDCLEASVYDPDEAAPRDYSGAAQWQSQRHPIKTPEYREATTLNI